VKKRLFYFPNATEEKNKKKHSNHIIMNLALSMPSIRNDGTPSPFPHTAMPTDHSPI
jgi:hypothetical protein